MKKLFKIITLICLVALSSCTEELEFDTEGILVLNIYDSFTGEPVANANVIAYRSIDDWAFDERRVNIFASDQNGQIVMSKAMEGQYYFDIVAGDRNNWENPIAHYIEDGSIIESYESIHRNINGIVSTTEGRQWQISQVFDDNGSDLPAYECMTDNIVNFTKAGAYEMLDQANDCDSIDDFFEASWWGVGEHYMGLVYDDGATVVELYINELTENSFIATEYREQETINYRYERLD
ncbi:hypothetical protein [Ekhidna sp.]|uniref:hypothetical protein n=1 Tax=Ekhidna sp. TaxID=2608089 RepID=UPI0032981179